MHGVNIGWEAITVMDARDYIQEQAAGFFGDLKEWLAIPSISADPGHHGDVRASAEWLAAHLRTTGFPQVEIWETGTADAPGLPAVFACWPAADTAFIKAFALAGVAVLPERMVRNAMCLP